jgi:hypothetical protein
MDNIRPCTFIKKERNQYDAESQQGMDRSIETLQRKNRQSTLLFSSC